MPFSPRRAPRCLLSLCLLALALPASAAAAPGDLDSTYGTDGRTASTFSSSASASAFAHLADGGDLLAGTVGFSQFAVAKYTAGGTLDPGFGKVETPLPNGATGSARAAAAWGSRVVVGGAYNSGGEDFVLAAYDAADGSLDTTFDADGFADTPIPGTAAGIDALAVQDLGAGGTKLVAAGASYDGGTGSYGIALARYDDDGSLDTGFGSNGTVTIDLGTAEEVQPRAIGVLSNGDLVLAGQHNHHAGDGSIDATSLYLARYTALSGYQARDAGFGTGGEVVTQLGGSSARATSLLVGAGDTLTVGGSFTPSGDRPHMLVARFDSTGAPDDAFGTAGKTALSFGDGFAFANALTSDAAGNVLAAGQFVPTSGGISFALARLTSAGAPDETFASGGKVTTSFGSAPGTEGDPKGIVVQPGGGIVVGGSEFGDHGGTYGSAFVIARYEGGSIQAADPPTVRVTSPPDGQWFSTTVPPAFTGTLGSRAGDHQAVDVTIYDAEGHEVQTIAATVSDDTWSAAPSPALTAGSYAVEALQGSDSAGTGQSGRVHFRVDPTAPSPAITAPAEGVLLGGGTEPTFSGTLGTQAEDASHSADRAEVNLHVSRVHAGTSTPCEAAPTEECKWIGSQVTGGGWTAAPLAGRADGTYDVRAYQGDVAQNIGMSAHRRVKIDRTEPSLVVIRPSTNQLFSSRSPTFSGDRGTQSSDEDHAADKAPVTVEVRRRGSDTALQSFTHATGSAWSATSSDLSDGSYDLFVSQADAAGNVARRTIPFKVDGTRPSLGADGPSGLIRDATPTLGGARGRQGEDASHSADRPGVTVALYRNGSLVDTYSDAGGGATWAVRTKALSDGDYGYIATQRDDAGNVASASRRFSVDATPPRPVVESPAGGQSFQPGDVRFAGTASPGDGDVTVVVHTPLGDQSASAPVGGDGRWQVSIALGGFVKGDHSVVATQTDAAGNVGTSPSIAFAVADPPAPPAPPAASSTGGGRTGPSVVEGDPTKAPVGDEKLPPPAPGCDQEIKIGPLEASSACFKREGSGLQQVWVSTAAVAMNGISFVPNGAGAKLILDPLHLRVAAEGRMQVQLNYRFGVITLWEGAFNWEFKGPRFTLPSLDVPGYGKVDLDKVTGYNARAAATTLPNGWKIPANVDASGITLDPIELNVGDAAKLLGLPLTGKAVLRVRNLAAQLHINVALPAAFSGFTGDTDLRIEAGKGVIVDSINVAVPQISLFGAVEVDNFHLSFNGPTETWDGGADVKIPALNGLSVGSEVTITRNELKRFRAKTGGLNWAVFGPVVLDSIDAEINTDPKLFIKGIFGLTAGPRVAGVAAAGITAQADYTFGDPGRLHLGGTLNIVDKKLGAADVTYLTTGSLDFSAHADWGLGPVSLVGDVTGWVDKPGFQVKGDLQMHQSILPWPVPADLGAQLIASSKGVAGCASWNGIQGGVGYRWGGGFDTWVNSCGIGGYEVSRSRARVAGTSQAVSIPSGRRVVSLAFEGSGAAPSVTLKDPGGRVVIAAPAAAGQGAVATGAVLAKFEDEDVTRVLLKSPAAGAWTVEVQDGSAPMGRVLTALPVPDPKVRASVAGHGRARALRYTMKRVPGVTVEFSEEGPQTKRIIGSARGASGSVRFAPGDGRAGRRRIVALISQDGLPWKRVTVASYVAPGPVRPSRPSRVSAARSGSKLVVRWSRVTHARRVIVEARLKGGRKLVRFVRGAARSVSIVALPTETSGSVSVRGVSATGRHGASRAARFAPPRPKRRHARR